MFNVVDSLMLICATLASLAFGVLVAYAVCRTAFVLLRWHARAVGNAAPQPAAQVAKLS